MNCPKDDTPLETHTIRDIQVDECPECLGFWFRTEELRKSKDAADPDLRWLDFDLWTDVDLLHADWSGRSCPQCGGSMMRIGYAETGVMIDNCPEGHGVWLDRGDFEAIIAALETEVATMDVPDYVLASLKEARDLFGGREGFVSDWKDFLTVTRLMQYRVLAEHPKLAELLLALQISNPLK